MMAKMMAKMMIKRNLQSQKKACQKSAKKIHLKQMSIQNSRIILILKSSKKT
jgi:hypothetical protein